MTRIQASTHSTSRIGVNERGIAPPESARPWIALGRSADLHFVAKESELLLRKLEQLGVACTSDSHDLKQSIAELLGRSDVAGRDEDVLDSNDLFRHCECLAVAQLNGMLV